MLTSGIPPDFRDGVHLFIPSTTTRSVPTVSRVTQLRTDDVHCRQSTGGAGPVVLNKVPVKRGLYFHPSPWTNYLDASLFPQESRFSTYITTTKILEDREKTILLRNPVLTVNDKLV